MPDELHRDARVGVELLFEVKNAERFCKAPAHEIHAPGAPSPELGANVVNVANALGAQLAGKAQVKAGEVCEDGKGRFASARLIHKMAHSANKRGQTLQHFRDAYNGDFGVVCDDFDASSKHLRPTHSEDPDIEALLQRGGEPRGVHVSGSFTGGEQERNGRHVRRGARSIARRQGGRLGSVANFEREMEFLLFVLKLIEAIVNAALGEKLLMRALFAQAAFVKDEDAIRVLNGAEAVGNHEGGASGKQAAQGFADLQFSFSIHARSGFIENQKSRIVGQGAGEIDELALANGKRRAPLVN